MFSNNDSARDSMPSTGLFQLGADLKARLLALQARQLAAKMSYREVLLQNDAILLTTRPGVALFLRFDGKFVVWDYDGLWGESREPHIEQSLDIIAIGLVLGAKELQIPELRELLPACPDNASCCAQCGPERVFYSSSSNQDEWNVCPFCKGLGWTVDPVIC